jgi:phthiocerol/phenolphthiocerol synthesis type-I polyketide synthase E
MTHEMDSSETIAVIGMAGRFPAAASVDELWNLLRAGGSAVSTPSDEELRALGVSEERLRHPNYVRARMRFEGADLFDAGFFGYSAKHAQMLDPQQRLFLECAWEAVESAGYLPVAAPTSIYSIVRASLIATLAPGANPTGTICCSMETRITSPRVSPTSSG